MKILLKSAKIIDPTSSFHQQQQDILIENGVISKISQHIEKPDRCKVIELDNLHVSSGWFDASVSFGEPGYEERENLTNGIETAAKSGFTSCALNANTNPVLDHKSAIQFIIGKAEGKVVDIYPIANLTQKAEGKELTEMYDMHNAGAIAFADYNKAIDNANLMKVALQYAQNFNGLVMSFPKDNSIATKGFVNESENTTRLGLKSSPALAEELRISRDLFLLEYTGGKLHIPTISTAKSLQLIKNAKKKGLNVTCSVTVHHLIFTDEALSTFNSNNKVEPPLRSKKDSKALIKGVIDGTIDFITSDHNPIDIENKKVELENAFYGTIGLESCFGALNSILELEQFIPLLTSKPREVFNIEQSKIEPQQKANLSLFNPDVDYVFSKDHILSKSKNAIFEGIKLKGKAYGTINNNKLILNNL